jgi:hypothetical protein
MTENHSNENINDILNQLSDNTEIDLTLSDLVTSVHKSVIYSQHNIRDTELNELKRHYDIVVNTTDNTEGDSNNDSGDTDYGNTGDGNTGDGNTGDGNTGDDNTGDGNTGDDNTGDGNTGDGNTGDGNTGDGNTGDGNTGDGNTGDGNIGDGNIGDGNIGDGNTGDAITQYTSKKIQFDDETFKEYSLTKQSSLTINEVNVNIKVNLDKIISRNNKQEVIISKYNENGDGISTVLDFKLNVDSNLIIPNN